MANYSDSYVVVLIAFLIALLVEGITYVLLYRTDKYKQLKDIIERGVKKVEKMKEGGDSNAKQAKTKKAEEDLKTVGRDLTMVKMRANLAVSLVFVSLLGMFSTIFEGRVVARLPFQPFSMLTGVTHRSLYGEDYTECSFIFLYMLLLMPIRTALQKVFGFGMSRAAEAHSGFSMAQPQK